MNPRCQICKMRHDPPLCQRLADGVAVRDDRPRPLRPLVEPMSDIDPITDIEDGPMSYNSNGSADSAAGIRVWPPADWCSAIDPSRTFICDQPRGHDGDHRGPEMPTVEIDE